MRRLIWGIVEFREQHLPQYAAQFRELAQGQSPDTLFVTCSDSRVVPNLLVSTDPGELFTMRNVGNLMPPASSDGLSTGDLSEASAIEYAVKILKVTNIVICGHSECGAMKAVLAAAPIDDAPNLEAWLQHAVPAVTRFRDEAAATTGLAPYDRVSQLNVTLQLEHLMSYPIVRAAVEAGSLRLSGWWFNIATGDMYVHRAETDSFTVIDRGLAQRIAGKE